MISEPVADTIRLALTLALLLAVTGREALFWVGMICAGCALAIVADAALGLLR